MGCKLDQSTGEMKVATPVAKMVARTVAKMVATPVAKMVARTGFEMASVLVSA